VTITSLDHIGFRCGDVVRHRGGRHEGVVLAAFNWTVRVRWTETRWLSDEAPEDLVLVREAERSSSYSAQVARNRRRIGL
jgi:hypothetical protein